MQHLNHTRVRLLAEIYSYLGYKLQHKLSHARTLMFSHARIFNVLSCQIFSLVSLLFVALKGQSLLTF